MDEVPHSLENGQESGSNSKVSEKWAISLGAQMSKKKKKSIKLLVHN